MPSPGITAGPAMLEGAADTKSRQTYKLVLRADRAVVPSGVQIVPLDITLVD